MPEKSASRRLNCPSCSETVLPEDTFCFHCGRRLKPKAAGGVSAPNDVRPKRRRFTQWPLAVMGAIALLAAGYEVHHQSAIIANLRATQSGHRQHFGDSGKKHGPVLHPVVTSTQTIYPANLPSPLSWTPEVETYRNVQFGLRVPKNLSASMGSSATQWTWGQANTPYRIVLSVVSAKTPAASVVLGPNTWGTPISRSSAAVSQDLFINWAGAKWVEVSMTVPASHVAWLQAIAKSVRVS